MKKSAFLKHEPSSNLSSSSSSSLKGKAGTPVPSKPLFKSAVFDRTTSLSLSDTPYSPQLVDTTPSKLSDIGRFNSTKYGWDVSKLSLLTLCVFYRLEPNHVFFSQDLLYSVLERLQDLFRQLSLSVQFRHGDANTTVSAVVRSMEGVQFVVYVWDSDNNQCILEVQRTGGPTEAFCGHGYAQKVLDIVRGFDCSSNDVDPMDFCMEQTKQNQDAVNKVWNRFGPSQEFQPKREDVDSSLQIVVTLLSSTFLHHVGMGLESLLSMTDPCNSGLESAMRCANEVVSGRFSDSILYLLNDGTHGHLALQVLTQALNLAGGQQVQDTTRKLVPFFLDCVGKAESSPHTAYLATHSLYITCKHCPDIQSEVRLHVIKDAEEFGRYGHAGLENSCKRLRGLLEYAHA